MAKKKKAPVNIDFETLYRENPHFHILQFDSHDKTAVRRLKTARYLRALRLTPLQEKKLLEELRQYQRLLRIEHLSNRGKKPAEMRGVANILKEAGFGSANQIALLPAHRFIREYAKLFNGDKDKTKRVYDAAKSIAVRTSHLFANLHHTVGSPHFRAMPAGKNQSKLNTYFENIPGYQDMFGSLNYIGGDHCTSIFGPAAYFQDMMRITDEYITDTNTKKPVVLNQPSDNIPDAYLLSARRPDLFELELNCENTNNLIPYLQIVNSVLERRVQDELQFSGKIASAENSEIIFSTGSSAENNKYKDMKIIITGGPGYGQSRIITAYDAIARKATVDAPWTKPVPDNKSTYNIIHKSLITGDAEAAGPLSIKLAAGTAGGNDAYTGMRITVFDDKGESQTRLITGYTSSTTTAIIDKEWSVPAPAKKSVYKIEAVQWQLMAAAKYPLNLPFNLPLTRIRQYASSLDVTLADIYSKFNKPFNTGKVVSATEYTIKLFETSSSVAKETTAGMLVKITDGKGDNQVRTIISYDKTTYTATIETPWQPTPDNTSVYQIIDTLAADREYIGLSIEEYQLLITGDASRSEIAAAYGLASPVGLTPPNKVETFLNYANIDWKSLDELLVLDLSHEELQSGKADKFYINNTGETGYMKILLDKSNPASPVYIIENLTWKRLDRLNRFIRLSRALSWSYADLNTALDSLGCNAVPKKDLSKQIIQSLALIKFLQANSALQVEELCSFWSDIKTSGKRNGRYPMDLFDRIFNNPALLNGQNPYASNPPVPFAPFAPRSVEWDITETTGSGGLIRSRLCAALQIDDNSLVSLAEFVCELVKASPKKLLLDLTNLSWLYRISKTASFFGLKMEAYRDLFELMYPRNSSGDLSLPPLSVYQSFAQWHDAQRFRKLPFTIYELQYVLKRKPGPFFKAPFKKDDIAPLLQTIWNDARTALINKSSFINNHIDITDSETIFEALEKKGFINTAGVVLNNLTSFNAAAKNYTLTESSFPFEQKENVEVINSLKNCYQPVLLADTNDKWKLSGLYQDNNPLGFLFANDSNAGYKRNLVRSVLTQTREKIQLLQFNFLFPLHEASFINGTIDATESKRIFELLKKTTPAGMSHPILLDALSLPERPSKVSQKSGEISGYLNPDFDKSTPLSFLFPPAKKTVKREKAILKSNQKKKAAPITRALEAGDTNTDLKMDMVRGLLLIKRQDIHQTVEMLNNSSSTQQQIVLNVVAGLLETSSELLSMIVPLADPQKNTRDYVTEFLKPVNEGQVSEKILKVVSGSYSAVLVFNKLSFTVAEIEALLNKPRGFNIDTSRAISYSNLQRLAEFKRLQTSLGDNSNVLITSFYLSTDSEGTNARTQLLAELTGWKEKQITALAKELDIKYETTGDITRIKTCFDSSLQTELSIEGLLQLERLGKLSLVDDNGNINQGNWLAYTGQSEILQSAVNARFTGGELEKVNSQNTASLNVRKRDALLWYCIRLLNGNGIPVKKPSDLYQYLLIDVEMSGCDNISYIAQAISSIQLYMQRCRMMLEPGVTDLSEIPGTWWQWMSSYRVWEANRKIFLYPENYIDPSLRKNATPAFSKFADTLMQTNISDETVTTAYTEYFDELSDLTRLGNCEGYACKRTVPGVKEPLDTVFFFGRTGTQPYTYFYRTFDSQSAWTPWIKMEITINSQLISPVFAFNRLFVFWTEVQETDTSKMEANNSIPITSIEATIKYSFLNDQQKWVQPQTLKSGIVIGYKTAYNYDTYAKPILEKIFTTNDLASAFNINQPCWQVPNAVHIPEAAFNSKNQHPNTECILVNYGFRITVENGQSMQETLATPNPDSPSAQFCFDTLVYDFASKYNQLRKNIPPTKAVDLNFLYPIFIDANLNVNSVPAIYTNNTPGTNCPRYKPSLQRSDNKLLVAGIGSSNVIAENYYPDNFSSYPSSDNSTGQFPILENIAGDNASIITTKNRPGSFIFDNGDESFFIVFGEKSLDYISDKVIVGTPSSENPKMGGEKFIIWSDGYFATKEYDKLKFEFIRLNTNVVNDLSQKLTQGGIDKLLTLESQETEELPFNRYRFPANRVVPPAKTLDFKGSYGIYFWETFFHAPFLVAKSLAVNQRHEEARRWYQFIYNPTQPPDPVTTGSGIENKDMGTDRFWRFLPFRSMTIESIGDILTSPAEIMAYNNDPFNPDAIAGLRTSAYAKTIVMRYIDNLIEWGDRLFEQDTRESITEAVNLYVMASDLLGERPQQVGEFKTPKSKTFNDIKNEYAKWKVASGMAGEAGSSNVELATGGSEENGVYVGMHIDIIKGKGAGQTGYLITGYTDKVVTVSQTWKSKPDKTSEYLIYKSGIPEFLIQLENAAPAFYGKDKAIPDISGVAFNNIDSYFSIPENPEFISYWQKVEDRLFKIRHCMNIRGQERTLALFEPPLDPRMVMNAGGRDGGFALPVQIPLYRFTSMIDKAKSLASTLTDLGSTLLSILEKKDIEALSLLRAAQEKTMLNLNTYIKEQQIQDLVKQKASLTESLNNAKYRKKYYNDLIVADLIPEEVSNIDATKVAMGFGIAASTVKGLSAILYAVPQAGSPFAMTYGGAQLGSVANAASEVLNIGTTIANYIAQLSLTMAGYKRRTSDWTLQAALAKFDATQIQYQIESNDINQLISQTDLANHKVAIQQSEAVEVFLEKKFTNVELYQWMLTRVSNVYFQTYSLAYDLARSAERAYQFELNVNDSFINYGYWNNLQKGLTAGETLMLALNQMEKTFVEKNNRLLEIEKTISLSKTNNAAYQNLVNNGECIFELTEKSFDDDYPGHFARKIKTISISIPAVIGPYQNIKATLTQLSSQVVTKPVPNTVKYLLGEAGAEMPGADELRSNWQVNQQIALSNGINDDGMFELNFNDERYLPFEGTGAVSSWKLSMPKANNHFDFNSISDVVIQLQYTAIDGGRKFRDEVIKLPSMRIYPGSIPLSLASAKPAQWFEFLANHNNAATQTLLFPFTGSQPAHVKNAKLTGFYFQLNVADTVKLAARNNFITLQFAGQKAINISIDNHGQYIHLFDNDILLKSIEGPCSVNFILNMVQKDLKKNKFLDPELIRDIKLIVFYTGTTE